MTYLLAILAYLLLLIFVGAFRSRSITSQDDFMVAGRRLTTPVLVGTLIATWIGTGSIFGSAGLGYKHGVAGIWFSVGAWLGMFLLIFLAGRARQLAQYTVPDILELRYNAATRVFGSLTIIIAYSGIVSYQLVAGGRVLHLVTGIDEGLGVLITMVFVVAYTALAGMFSVAYTDVANGIVIVLGLIIGFPFILSRAGGLTGMVETLEPSHFTLLGDLNPLQAIALSLPTLFLLLGEANMYQRFFAARSSRTAQRAVYWWIAGVIFVESLILAFAIVASSAFLGLENPDNIIVFSAKEGVPVAVGCLLLAVIVAVIVSTADSFLLVPSTNLMRDFYQRFLNPEASQGQMVFLSRIVVIVLGVVAYLQTLPGEQIIDMILRAYTMYGASITPALMAAFFWPRATKGGGLLSVVSGISMTLVWEFLSLNERMFTVPVLGETTIPTIYPAIISSILALTVVSLISPPPDEKSLRPFATTR